MKPTFANISTLTASVAGWIGLFILAFTIGQLIQADFNGQAPDLFQTLTQFVIGCLLIAWGTYAYNKALKVEAKAKVKTTHFKQAA